MKHPSFGYRRIWAMLARAGIKINLKKVYRLWKQEKLSLTNQETAQTESKADYWNNAESGKAKQVWRYDFVFNQSSSGKSLKMLTLIDEFIRECLAVEVGISIKSERVKQVLRKVCLEKGFPEILQLDNGSEFISQAVNNWLFANEIKLIFIEPG